LFIFWLNIIVLTFTWFGKKKGILMTLSYGLNLFFRPHVCLLYYSLIFVAYNVQAYMVELYQDNLVDLLLPKSAKQQKLEIKKDSKV
jgi:uncharacterized membrane protein